MPSVYIDNNQYVKEAIDEPGTLNQRYRGRMKGVKSSKLGKSLILYKSTEEG